jgi:hypothetical protein
MRLEQNRRTRKRGKRDSLYFGIYTHKSFDRQRRRGRPMCLEFVRE